MWGISILRHVGSRHYVSGLPKIMRMTVSSNQNSFQHFLRPFSSSSSSSSSSTNGGAAAVEENNEWVDAINKGDIRACQRLISTEKGKDIHHRVINPEGWTALHAAAARGNTALVDLLLTTGAGTANVDLPDNTGMTPLHWAAFRGNKPAVRRLLAMGARTDAKDLSGANAESWALTGGHKDIADYIIAVQTSQGEQTDTSLSSDDEWLLSVYGATSSESIEFKNAPRSSSSFSSGNAGATPNTNTQNYFDSLAELQEQLAEERNRAAANSSKLQHYSEVRTLVTDLVEEEKRRDATVRTLQKCHQDIARKFKTLADYMATVNLSDGTEAERNRTAAAAAANPAANGKAGNKPMRTPAQILELRRKALRQLHLGFEGYGIGGLDIEIARLMEEVLLSRSLSVADRAAFGINHNKGILLYGPPGNGKTLIARTVANLLQCIHVTVVNGSEMDARWVGETEKNIKSLFNQATNDWKLYGEDSELHCIIFDEIDSIGSRRGRDVNRHSDRALNMLLSCIDGVEQIGNVIIFGLTNRKDMLDPALIRAGRLGTHIEILPPGLKARESILRVHTAAMRVNSRLAADVDLTQLALKTQGYSGADLMDLVGKAMMLTLRSSFVNSIDGVIMEGEKLPADIKVSKAMFEQAMDLIERNRQQ